MEWGTSLEDLEDSQDFSNTSYDMLCNQPFTRRAERAITLQHSEFEACLSHGKFHPLLEVLIGWLSPEGSGQVWVGHFIWSSQHQALPQGRLGKMRYRKRRKAVGPAVGKCH